MTKLWSKLTMQKVFGSKIVELSRYIESKLNREEEDYELEVGRPVSTALKYWVTVLYPHRTRSGGID